MKVMLVQLKIKLNPFKRTNTNTHQDKFLRRDRKVQWKTQGPS